MLDVSDVGIDKPGYRTRGLSFICKYGNCVTAYRSVGGGFCYGRLPVSYSLPVLLFSNPNDDDIAYAERQRDF